MKKLKITLAELYDIPRDLVPGAEMIYVEFYIRRKLQEAGFDLNADFHRYEDYDDPGIVFIQPEGSE